MYNSIEKTASPIITTFIIKGIDYLCQEKMDAQIKGFKIISTLEAISFLVLLLIAMPLKYIWGLPKSVEIIGMAHGVLFVLYVLGAFWMYRKLNWSIKMLFISVLCSVLPLGPFYIERKYLPRRT